MKGVVAALLIVTSHANGSLSVVTRHFPDIRVCQSFAHDLKKQYQKEVDTAECYPEMVTEWWQS